MNVRATSTMAMRSVLPELLALPLLPLLLLQGRHVRRVTPRLPEASGPCSDVAGSQFAGQPLSLLAVGESPVAGVGVDRHCNAITGQFALALALRLQRPVAWNACGRNGVTTREALETVIPRIPAQQIDVALVAFGVNDTTAFHSARRWRQDLRDLLQTLDARCKPRIMLLSGVAPVGHFPALPQPLRAIMGLKARLLDDVARDIAASTPHVCHVPMALDPTDVTLMASDGYHPSAKGCNAWAQLLTQACLRVMPQI